MTTRLVRQTNRFRITAIVALCLLVLVGVTSFALNRSGNRQKDPTAIAYEEDEDPLPEGVASLMDTAKSLHGTIDTITYEQSYEGTTYTKQAYVYVPASYASDTPANVLYLTHGWWGNAAGLADGFTRRRRAGDRRQGCTDVGRFRDLLSGSVLRDG